MARLVTVRGVPVRWTLVPSGKLGALEPWWTRSLSRASRDEVSRGYVCGRTTDVLQEAAWALGVVAATTPASKRRRRCL